MSQSVLLLEGNDSDGVSPNPLTWDYLAGLLDTDGGAYLRLSSPKRTPHSSVMHGRIKWQSTDEDVMIDVGGFLGLPVGYSDFTYIVRTAKGNLIRSFVPKLAARCVTRYEALCRILEYFGLSIPLRRMTLSWNYVAGFLDGDGCPSVLGHYLDWRGVNEEVIRMISNFLGHIPIFSELLPSGRTAYRTRTAARNTVVRIATELHPRSHIARKRLRLQKLMEWD